MAFFDTHAHYDDPRFDEDRDRLLAAMPANGVSGIVIPATNLASAKKCIAYANAYEFIWAAVGIHPSDAGEAEPGDLARIEALAKSEPRVKAIGEIGLEYHYDDVPQAVQKAYFHAQLAMAKRLDLPVIVHDREAHADVFAALDTPGLRGVIHCYSGSAEMAKAYVKRGYMLSFTGAVTFKNARKSNEVIASVPMTHIMIETDAPYLAPEPCRGRRNDSTLVRYVAEKIAAIKDLSADQVGRITAENARRFFRL